jgi:hypothetical protein
MGLINKTQQNYYNNNDDFGGYQFVSIDDIINNFTATFVGEGKILSNVLKSDISFHAHRALAELSFDTFKSCKSQEIEVPPHLTMPLPQDYVNYVKLVWSDAAGIEHTIYPASKTSNPNPIQQNSDGDYIISAVATFSDGADNVVLDGEYKDIKTGMIFHSQHVTNPAVPVFITGIRNASSITTLYLSENVSWTGATGASTGNQETITVTEPNHSLSIQNESAHIVEDLSWNITDYHITASSADDITDIKPGMLVVSDRKIGTVGTVQFLPGTRVVAVNNTIITVDKVAVTATTSGGEITFISDDKISDTWSKYKGSSGNSPAVDTSLTTSATVDADNYFSNTGQRYGLDPQYAQTNGSFFIDCADGKIHFSSNLSGKTIILKYISDSLGTDGEMQVHKFAEEAMYKWIAYGCLISRIGIPEYIIARFKKEKFAETRKAKLRLSNIKLEEITQIFRGKSKQIKH